MAKEKPNQRRVRAFSRDPIAREKQSRVSSRITRVHVRAEVYQRLGQANIIEKDGTLKCGVSIGKLSDGCVSVCADCREESAESARQPA